MTRLGRPKKARSALLVGVLVSCGPERPPAPEQRAAPEAIRTELAAVGLNLATDAYSLTYAGDRGEFKDSTDPSVVPARARGLVRVNLLDGRRPPAGMSYVVNLDGPSAAGVHPLETIRLDMFEELALGRGLSSAVTLPGDLSAPPPPPARDVVVYKTDWCGVCKQLTAYLDKKGVPYVTRDIEKDVGAAAELRAKAEKAGVATGSVPVIDVKGSLMVGFDRERLEQMFHS